MSDQGPQLGERLRPGPRRQRLLDELDVEGLEPLEHGARIEHVPRLVAVEPQADSRKSFANRPDDVEIEGIAPAGLDIQHLEALLGEAARMRGDLGGRVALDESEVLHRVVHRAAEELMERLTRRLAHHVPQGELESCHCLREIARRPAGAFRIEARQVVVPNQPVAVIGGLAGERRYRLVQDLQHRSDCRARDRLADPRDPAIRLDLDEDDRSPVIDAARPVIGLLEGAKQRRGGDADDLHVESPMRGLGALRLKTSYATAPAVLSMQPEAVR